MLQGCTPLWFEDLANKETRLFNDLNLLNVKTKILSTSIYSVQSDIEQTLYQHMTLLPDLTYFSECWQVSIE